MILSYSNPQFKAKILAGTKIHTIREDKHDRWREGMGIQHWMYSPRNVSKSPHCFANGVCRGVQKIVIYTKSDTVFIDFELGSLWLTQKQKEQLAFNDGFESWQAMKEWFRASANLSGVFRGKIIHFTDFKYQL